MHLNVATTGATGGTSDQLGNIQALQFSDFTEIVAPAPGTGNTVTGGNVTELYGAVFGRVPDVAGLSFYEKALAANPGLSLQSLAEDFLFAGIYRQQRPQLRSRLSRRRAIHRRLLYQPAGPLVCFSASAEFLGDVQVTAAHPASAGFNGHWLVSI